MILEVNSLPKIFDSMRIRIFNLSCPPRNYLAPPIGGVLGGSGSPIIGTPISNFIGGSESESESSFFAIHTAIYEFSLWKINFGANRVTVNYL